MALQGVKDLLATRDAKDTVMAMGAWCGLYYIEHHSLYYLSFLKFPRKGLRTEEQGIDLDAPQPKYAGSSLRRVSAARLVALTHALASWGWSVHLIHSAWPWLRRGPGWFAYDAPTSPAALAFMRHSLGYFVQELAHVLLFEPDIVYIAHHLLYLGATYPVALDDKGWAFIAIATAFAEATNPLQLLWELAKAFHNEPLYHRLSLPFTLAFVALRGVVMPIFLVDMARTLRARPDPVLQWTLTLFTAGVSVSLLCVSFTRSAGRHRLDRPARSRLYQVPPEATRPEG